MDIITMLINSLWSGLFAGTLGFILTAPVRYIAPTFFCGFVGRFARDLFTSMGVSQNWSTAIASAVVVLVAIAIIRRHEVSPVVLVSGVLPLGAAVAMFNAIASLMKVSYLSGEALSAASVALSANMGKVFTTSLAIAMGLAAGLAIVRLFSRGEVREGI
jgi:uncharacterized membrane protein YjjB (DUF3815 family)